MTLEPLPEGALALLEVSSAPSMPSTAEKLQPGAGKVPILRHEAGSASVSLPAFQLQHLSLFYFFFLFARKLATSLKNYPMCRNRYMSLLPKRYNLKKGICKS